MALLHKRQQIFFAVIFCTLWCASMLTIAVEANEVTTTTTNPNGNIKKTTSSSVKKDLTALKQEPSIEVPQTPVELHDVPEQKGNVISLNEKVMESEKSNTEKKAAIAPPAEEPLADEKTQKEMEQLKEDTKQPEPSAFPVETQHHNNDGTFTVGDEFELPENYKAGFYFFFAVSSIGVAIILVKLYRMRLTRAERRYGVQGDRSTQELTPLPIAIEDTNSDEDDHTLFEINREQIRIL